jgi:hypothetical protein
MLFKQLFLSVSLVLLVFNSNAQIQWANEVVEFSSQNTSLAKQQSKASHGRQKQMKKAKNSSLFPLLKR